MLAPEGIDVNSSARSAVEGEMSEGKGGKGMMRGSTGGNGEGGQRRSGENVQVSEVGRHKKRRAGIERRSEENGQVE